MADPPQTQRRKVLGQAVALMVQETGYESADKVALEMLTEMFQSCKLKMDVIEWKNAMLMNCFL